MDLPAQPPLDFSITNRQAKLPRDRFSGSLECGSLLPPWFGEACFASFQFTDPNRGKGIER
jgi:hypothetical protein